jgi:tetratricopeptide (TPR) repeat protein
VTRTVFRALGRHPRETFDRYAAAALADLDVAEIDDRLDELVDAYLLETPTAGRYRLHDLVHDYAAALLAAEHPEQDAAVTDRLLTHYLYAAAAATAHYERAAARATLPLDEPPPTVPPFADTGQAVAWLDSTWLNVVAAVELADAARQDGYTWRLGRALWAYLYRNGHSNELVGTLSRALGAVRRLGDAAAEATVHNYLASGYANLKRYDLAERHMRESHAIRRRLGDQRGVITALNNLALVQLYGAGRLHDAVAGCREALDLAEQIGADQDVYLCARTLGFAYRMLGYPDEARAWLERALAGFEHTGQKSWLSMTLGELGGAYAAGGDPATGIPLLRRSLEMKRVEGNRGGGFANVLSMLGEAYQALGRGEEAIRCHREALALLPDGHHIEPSALNAYGRTLLARGNRDEALAAHRRALDGVGTVGNPYERAKAHDGIAAASYEVDPAVAEEHWWKALEIYGDMDVPEATEVRRRLAGLDRSRRSAV